MDVSLIIYNIYNIYIDVIDIINMSKMIICQRYIIKDN